MMVDANSKECPICSYEFAETKAGYRWVAILLLVIMLMYYFL